MKKEMFVLIAAVIFLGGNPAFSQTFVRWDDSFLIATVDPGSEEAASVFYETLDMPEQREMYGYSKLFITSDEAFRISCMRVISEPEEAFSHYCELMIDTNIEGSSARDGYMRRRLNAADSEELYHILNTEEGSTRGSLRKILATQDDLAMIICDQYYREIYPNYGCWVAIMLPAE